MKSRKMSLSMPKGYSKLLHASVLFLTLFGLFMIVSAATNKDTTSSSNIMYILVKEIAFIVLSYVIMVFAARNYSHKLVSKYYILLLVGSIGMLLLPLAFSATGDTRAWIRIASITLQPSEFAKISVILIIAHSLGDRKNPNRKVLDLITHPILIISTMVAIVVFAQKDFGSGLIMLGIAVFCGLVPSHRSLSKTQNFLFTAALLVLFLMFFSVSDFGMKLMNFIHIPEYMINRFKTSYNPFFDRYDTTMQIFNGLAAFVQGGWFGVGYGNGFLKYNYIFAVDTDSILASIVEELGFVFGFLPILISYGLMVFELMKNTFSVKSEKDRIVLVGTIGYIFFHFFLNVGGVTAMIPLTGVPLLLVSAGGSSRMAIMLALGICQNIIARNKMGTLPAQRKAETV